MKIPSVVVVFWCDDAGGNTADVMLFMCFSCFIAQCVCGCASATFHTHRQTIESKEKKITTNLPHDSVNVSFA